MSEDITAQDLEKVRQDLEELKTLESILNSNNSILLEYLREEIQFVLKKAGMNKRIFVAFFNTLLREISRRMK